MLFLYVRSQRRVTCAHYVKADLHTATFKSNIKRTIYMYVHSFRLNADFHLGFNCISFRFRLVFYLMIFDDVDKSIVVFYPDFTIAGVPDYEGRGKGRER